MGVADEEDEVMAAEDAAEEDEVMAAEDAAAEDEVVAAGEFFAFQRSVIVSMALITWLLGTTGLPDWNVRGFLHSGQSLIVSLFIASVKHCIHMLCC